MRSKRIAGPAIIIALGIIFLLNNFGYLPWEIWGSLWRFWPVILIIIGLEILFERTSNFRFLLLVIFLIFLLPLILSGFLPQELGGREAIPITQKLGTLIGSSLDINLPTGDLSIEPLASFSAQLVEGEVSYSKVSGRPNIDFQEDKGIGITKIKTGNIGGSVKLKITPNVPLTVNIFSGASSTNLNLENLLVNDLKLETGASKVTINFSKNGPTKAEIKGGAANIEITIPEGLEAKIHPESSALKLNLDQERFRKTQDVYQTVGYKDDIRNKLDLEIKTSVANITVK